MSTRAARLPGERKLMSPAPQELAGFDHADEGGDQVVLGGDHMEVDTGPAGGVADGCLLLLPGGPQPQPELGITGVDDQLLARLGILHDQQASVAARTRAGRPAGWR